MYIPTDLSVTGPQLVKLFKGYPVQISKDALKNCNSRCLMHPMMSKKVEKARKSGKGCRIVMSPEEIMKTGPKGMKGSGMSGTGFFSDAWNFLRTKIPVAFNWAVENVPKAARFIKENVIDTPLYQEKIRPKVEGEIMKQLERLPGAYYDTAKDVVQSGFDYTGIGVKKRRGGRAITQKQTKKTVAGSYRPTGY